VQDGGNSFNAEDAELKREFAEEFACSLRTPSVLCVLCVEVAGPELHRRFQETV
jgi:hypothetical protein